MKKEILKYSILLLLLSEGSSAFLGIGGINSATETTQIANNIQLALQYSKQIEQYATQVKEYQTQIKQYNNQLSV